MNTWFYGYPQTREVIVGTSATTAAAGATNTPPARLVVLKADPDNAGTVYFTTNETTITAETGSTNDTSGYPLEAGQESPPMFVAGLDQVQLIASQASQGVFVLYHTGGE